MERNHQDSGLTTERGTLPENPVPCMMECLSNPSLRADLPGILLEDGRLSCIENQFPCCGGSGVQRLKDGIRRCRLSENLRCSQRLATNFFTLWGGSAKIPSVSSDGDMLSFLADLTRNRRANMRGFTIRSAPGHPSDLWFLAFQATWRFGCDVHCYHLERSRSDAILPKGREFGRTRSGLILVEGVSDLTKQGKLTALEALVNYAYNGCFPLWLAIEHTERSDDATGRVFSVTEFVGRNRQRLQRSDPMRYLSPEGKSRLAEVTDFRDYKV